MADLKCHRYNFIKLSISLLFLCSLLSLLLAIVAIVLSEGNISLVDPLPLYVWPKGSIGICLIIFSLGMFDAVLVWTRWWRPPQTRLVHSHHWYYWSMNIGIGVQVILVLCGLPLLSSCILRVNSIVHKKKKRSSCLFIHCLSYDPVTSSSCISCMFFSV